MISDWLQIIAVDRHGLDLGLTKIKFILASHYAQRSYKQGFSHSHAGRIGLLAVFGGSGVSFITDRLASKFKNPHHPSPLPKATIVASHYSQ